MTRRPKSRRPPKLHDDAHDPTRRARLPSPRERLKDSHVTGRSARFGRDEVVGTMRRLVNGDPRARLGLPPFAPLTMDQVQAALTFTYGWSGDGPRVRIDPGRTVDSFGVASTRVLEVARTGGRIACATTRPAALLGVYRALAEAAAEAGGKLLERIESGVIDGRSRRLWWIDGVAVVTDRESLLADDGIAAAEELLFVVEPPDLVVADRGFAGTALAAGLEVVALAGLDALALGVAAWRGMAIRVVPLDDLRPPAAYEPLLEILDDVVIRSEPDPVVPPQPRPPV